MARLLAMLAVAEQAESKQHKKPLFASIRANVNLVVPKTGLEPVRILLRGILSPLRLPFRHSGPEMVPRVRLELTTP